MSRIRSFLTVRVLVAALIIAFGAALYIASMPKSDAAGLVCTYYSDATYRTAVGGRGSGCCGASLNWGVITAFKKCQTLVCTQQICPN